MKFASTLSSFHCSELILLKFSLQIYSKPQMQIYMVTNADLYGKVKQN